DLLVAVAVREAHDPLAHLLRGEPVVAGQAGVALEVDHAGQGDAVVGPAAAVVEEEVGLFLGTAGIGAGEVIAAAGEAGIAGAEELVVESGAAVGAALRGLDIGEAGAELGLRGPVDLTLPAGDILPVQAGGLSGGGSEGGGAGAEGGLAEHPSAQQGAARGARGPGGRCGRGEVAGMVGRHDVSWGGGGSGEREATVVTP